AGSDRQERRQQQPAPEQQPHREERAAAAIPLVRRDFTVNMPLARAWDYLSRVEQWPNWVWHVKQVQLEPSGQLGPESSCALRLSNGRKVLFQMLEYRHHKRWRWSGRFLWATIRMSFRFQEQSYWQTRLSWTVECEGFGSWLLRGWVASFCEQAFDLAIP